MAVGSTLATCPPTRARDDDNTKARGPVPSTASTALAWAGGYLRRCSHFSGPLVGTVSPSALPRVSGAATSSLSPGSLGADPFSPPHLSLGGSSGSLQWDILT